MRTTTGKQIGMQLVVSMLLFSCGVPDCPLGSKTELKFKQRSSFTWWQTCDEGDCACREHTSRSRIWCSLVLLALQAVLVSTPSSPGQLTLCHSTPPVLLVKYINGKLHLARRQCQLERGRAFLQLQYLPVTKVLLLLHQSSAQNPQLYIESSL